MGATEIAIVCVWFTLTTAISIASTFLSCFVGWLKNKSEFGYLATLILLNACLGASLTYILLTKGMI